MVSGVLPGAFRCGQVGFISRRRPLKACGFHTLDLFTPFNHLPPPFSASSTPTRLTFGFPNGSVENRRNATPATKLRSLIGSLCFQVSLQLSSLSIKNIGNNTRRYATVCLTFKMASPPPSPVFHPSPPLPPFFVFSHQRLCRPRSEHSSLRTGGEYGFQGNKPSHAAPRDRS